MTWDSNSHRQGQCRGIRTHSDGIDLWSLTAATAGLLLTPTSEISEALAGVAIAIDR